MRLLRSSCTALLAVSVLFLGGFSLAAESIVTQPSPVFPKALEPGDTIQIIAPAKYLDEEAILLAKRRLELLGFKVRMPSPPFRKEGFFSGTDSQRARELMDAFCDPEVQAIFPGTGGYGTTRIVDKLDYETIRRHPKILIGFSDITGLHIAINQRTGLVTFHSPNPQWGLGSVGGQPPYEGKWFWRAILAETFVQDKRGLLGEGYTIVTQASSDTQYEQAKLFHGVPRPVTMRPGKGRGRLIGGNLSVLIALMGTPFEIQTEGKILFLEDIGEAPYRVDRMLNTLRLAGKFRGVKGIILGQFTTRNDEAKWDDDQSMDDVFEDYFGELQVPVIANFPVGHVTYNTTLPVGAMAELDADALTVRILETPVTLPVELVPMPKDATPRAKTDHNGR